MFNELYKKDRRKTNIIIFTSKESNDYCNLKFVNSVFSSLSLSIRATGVMRLGKIRDKLRPLKVTLLF